MQLNPDVYFERANEEMSVQKVEETGIPTVALIQRRERITHSIILSDGFQLPVKLRARVIGQIKSLKKVDRHKQK